jgi:allantoinase
VERGLDLERLAALIATMPALRFGLAPAKGALAVGADADVLLIDPQATWTIARDDLLDRHRLSPFTGMTLRGRIVRTILRGHTIAIDGAVVGEPLGRVLRRASPTA